MDLAFLCLELQQWCGTIPGHLPDSPHHAGHSVERHSGREFFICLPLWHFSGSIIQYNSGCLFFPLLFTGWPRKLWETQTGRCRLLVVSCINYWQISILFFLFYILTSAVFYCFLYRNLRFSLRFGSFKLLVPITVFQSTLVSPPGCRRTRCSQTRRGETHTKPLHIHYEVGFLFYLFLSVVAMNCLVDWSLQLTSAPALPTHGAVICSQESSPRKFKVCQFIFRCFRCYNFS